MRNSLWKTLLLIAVFAISASEMWGQSDTAVLFGLAKDPSGAIVPGAKVQLRNEDTGVTREVVADVRGLFYFTLLPPGNYELTVEAQGFKLYRDSHLRLQVAQVGRV